MKDLRDTMQKKLDGIIDWLKENHPGISDEQNHLNSGSPERAYWHYGYAVALRDMLAQMPPPDQVDN